MNLEEIIKAIRVNELEDLLGNTFADVDFDKIIIYAEHKVNADTNYTLFKSKRGMKKNLLKDGINYEELCSLQELCNLIGFFLSEYAKKDDDVLVINILDHLDHNN